MQKINRATSAPIAAAFFILSFATLPISLKVVGFALSLNPSMSAVVDVWNQIAGNFGGGYQPPTSAELIAINNLDSNKELDKAIEPARASSVLAKLEETKVAEAYQIQFPDVEIEGLDATATRAKSMKAEPRPAQRGKRAGSGAYYREIQARIEQHAEALKAAEIAQREMAAQSEEFNLPVQKLAAFRFDFGRVLKGLANKDVRVLVKAKQIKPVAPKVTACDLRTALTGIKNSETQQKEARARAVDSAATIFENCEL